MTPLTPEQQALCVQWKGLACKYTLKMMSRRASLAHMMDEAESIAFEALCCAAVNWRPADAPFPACLIWQVRKFVNRAECQYSRVVHHNRHNDGPTAPHAFSLNETVHGGIAYTGESTKTTFLDLVCDESEPPSTDVEVRDAIEALLEALPAMVRTGAGMASARKSVSMWEKHVLGGQTFDVIAKRHGISRQAVQCRVEKVNAATLKWAEKVKREAA